MMIWDQCTTETTDPARACARAGSGPAAAAPLGVASATAREDEGGGYPAQASPATTWRVVERWDAALAPSTPLTAVLAVVRAWRIRGHSTRLSFDQPQPGNITGLLLLVSEQPSLAIAALATEAERANVAHATAEQWGGA